MSSQIKPALTTIYVPSAEMGENAAEYLVAQIRHELLEPPSEAVGTQSGRVIRVSGRCV